MEKIKRKFLAVLFMALMFSVPAFSDNIEDAAIFYNEAIDLYGQEEYEKSIELFKKATELNPDFYEAYYNLAQILMSQNRYDEAYPALVNILKLKPKDTETLYNLGKTQYNRGYLSSAYDYLKQIPATAPQYATAESIMSKIKARQAELLLEKQIASREIKLDQNSVALPTNLIEVKAPSGIAVDLKGNIYVASFSDNTIYRISTKGKKTPFVTSNLLKGPVGLAMDKQGNLYSANYMGNSITKITPDGKIELFANIQKPYCIFYDHEHNRLYATEQNFNKLVKFDI